MSRSVLRLSVAAVLVIALAIHASAATASTSIAGYMTTRQMESNLKRAVLELPNGNAAVLRFAGCMPKGKARRSGSQRVYRRFVCVVALKYDYMQGVLEIWSEGGRWSYDWIGDVEPIKPPKR